MATIDIILKVYSVTYIKEFLGFNKIYNTTTNKDNVICLNFRNED